MFAFATARRIRFGDGVVSELPSSVAEHGSRALVVTGSRPERHARILDALAARGLAIATFSVMREPTTEVAERGVTLAREHEAEVIVAIGGGSVIDAGKAIAVLLTNGGVPLDYLEVIGAGKKIERPCAPFIAVPTTAGTGAEVTKNAVLESEQHRVKVSLRSEHMLPVLALVDPVLTYDAPPPVTASTGLDALTQVIEPFVSCQHNPLTDAICREGIARAARSLRRAYEDGGDRDARRDMALASLFGGLALANAKLGAVHGFAGPIGGARPSPHGAVCARLLPFVIETNVRALKERAPDSELLRRYDELGRMLTGDARASAEDAVRWTYEIGEALSIPALGQYGITRDDVGDLVESAARASSMQGNPIVLTRDELRRILEEAL